MFTPSINGLILILSGKFAVPIQSGAIMKTELDKKIKAFEKNRADEKAPMFKNMKGSSAGRVGYEFLIATLFFAGIGFVIDMQLSTTPWVTLGLFFIGFITGIYNAWRVMNVDGEKVGAKYKTAPKSELGSHDITMPAARKRDDDENQP